MGKLNNLKAFAPYRDESDDKKPEAAKMSASHSKTYKAMTLALRPCGVTAYEAAEQLNALGGQPYSPSYTKSAQFSPSYYSRLGYGAFGRIETVGDHIAAVKAAAGEDEAEYARACLPDSINSDDSEVLVIYAYAQGGKAVARYGDVVLDDLPSSEDEAIERREKLSAKPKRQRSRGGKKKAAAKDTSNESTST